MSLPRILVVEDDDINFKLLQVALKKLSLDIVHAATGEEAIRRMTEETFPLVLLDITLPDMKGWKVLDHFRVDGRLANTRVIVITGHTEPIHRVIGSMQSSVVAYLTKPIKIVELQQHVRELLNLHNA